MKIKKDGINKLKHEQVPKFYMLGGTYEKGIKQSF